MVRLLKRFKSAGSLQGRLLLFPITRLADMAAMMESLIRQPEPGCGDGDGNSLN